MRGIYDGPTTGKHGILTQAAAPARATKSLDLPRSQGTAAAAADLGLMPNAEAKPQDDAHLQLRQATASAPRDIPGAGGTSRHARPQGPNVGLFMRFVSSSARPADHRAHAGSPPFRPKPGASSLQAAQDLLASPPK